MSDFLKKVKSIFIVEDETPASANRTAAPTTNTPTAAPTVNSVGTPPPPPPPIATGAVSDRFTEVLSAALEKNNQPGFDYIEFRQALRNLAKMPMDEQTRFQSAFAMAQTMGITAPKLIESAQYYLQVLGGEQAKFKEAHAQQRARLIGGREDEIKNLEAQIRQKTEQIQQLTQQIEAHRQQSLQIRQEIDGNTQKIESTRADFETTFQAFVAQMQDDVAKMQNYLK